MKFPPSGLRGLALREAAPDMMRIINLVRAALELKVNGGSDAPGEGRKWFDIEAVYDASVVMSLDGRKWSYPYTLTDGVVALADPIEVIETFTPLKECAPSDGFRIVESDGADAGTVYEATLIQAGVSANNVFYSDQVLREAAPRFDGIRICMKSDEKHFRGGGRDIGTVIGWGRAPRFVEGATADSGRIVGTLHLPGLPDNTRNLLRGALAAGKNDIAGLSIDATGRGSFVMREGRRVKAAQSIDRVESVDLIVEPGAGGRLIRLVESAPDHHHQGDDDMQLRALMLSFIESKAPERFAKIDPATISDHDLETTYREAAQAAAAGAPNNTTDPMAGVEERLRMIECRAQARATLAASNLPAPAKERLQRVFDGRERFIEADVTAAIDEERTYLARYTESGRVNLGDFGGGNEPDRPTKIKGMFDAFFDPAHKDHRSAQSFRECYIEVTGDKRVSGRLADCDLTRMAESLGTFREAVADSTTFAAALGDSITRRMVADYNTASIEDSWRDIATIVPLSDFRTQHRVRAGGYGDIAVVAEKGTYQELGVPAEEEATYKAVKRGGLAPVTLEMIRNDDVGLIRRMPTELSRAAKRTLSKFVFDMLRTNPVIFDGKALFHADHNNLGTLALTDDAAWPAARLAMMKQTRLAGGERMSIPPKFIFVPAELEQTAYDKFKVRGLNNDLEYIQTTAPAIRPVWYWTDANDWVAAASPQDIPSIEIGFLDGREEPELLIQDMPTVGSVFSNDIINYKLRHIYSGTPVDFRGLYKAVVA